MSEEKLIYLAFPLNEADQATLRGALLPSERCLWAQHLPKVEQREAFLRAEIAFGNVPLEWIEESRHLRWLQLFSAGVNPYHELDWDSFPNLTVTNLRNFFGQPVAETAVAGILAVYRKIDELARLQAEQKWVGGALRPQMHLLHKKNALILGGGSIGLALEALLKGFSCITHLITRTGGLTLANLDELLPQADLIINCLPETAKTEGVISAQRLSLMKPTALLVNVGRGTAVDESALLEALRVNKLAGAVLDVTLQEPLPEDHPLWDCPNVLLTQHTGGGFEAEDSDKVQVFIQNLQRYRAGKPLLNVVDFTRGY
jgi:glyoxylate/hydroxypyruvate reductase A